MKCIVVDDDKVQRDLISAYCKKCDLLDFSGSCENAIEASNFIRLNPQDLIFLDVEMPEMTGLEFLKNLVNKPQIVLITGNQKYALDAYNNNVTDYLLKPISYARFLNSVHKASTLLNRTINPGDEVPKDIYVKVDSMLEKILLKDIIYIEAAVDYIHISTNSRKYFINSTMKSILESLPSQNFIRVHRSFIISVSKIIKIDGNLIDMGANLVPISRSYKEEVMRKINLVS
ncbi:MAG: response regulator transcription factor [Flavobacteriales bacterium]|nr:response regulator transcription factor [Flavobacteriales bacterium]